MHLQYMYRVAQKQAHFVLYALTSSNIDRFSNLFDCLNQENLCNNTVTKDPTTPQVCRYTTLGKLPWISVLKATVENKTTSVTTHFKSASSSSKADTLNILCKNCRMRQLVWIIIEKINTLFPVVTVLKCVVTKVALFSIVVFKTLTFHKVVQQHIVGVVESLDGSIITNVQINLKIGRYLMKLRYMKLRRTKKCASFWATLYIGASTSSSIHAMLLLLQPCWSHWSCGLAVYSMTVKRRCVILVSDRQTGGRATHNQNVPAISLWPPATG